MKQILNLTDIDYKGTAEGRLLFSALAFLTTTTHRDKTPDEVIEELNNHADAVEQDAIAKQKEWDEEINQLKEISKSHQP